MKEEDGLGPWEALFSKTLLYLLLLLLLVQFLFRIPPVRWVLSLVDRLEGMAEFL